MLKSERQTIGGTRSVETCRSDVSRKICAVCRRIERSIQENFDSHTCAFIWEQNRPLISCISCIALHAPTHDLQYMDRGITRATPLTGRYGAVPDRGFCPRLNIDSLLGAHALSCEVGDGALADSSIGNVTRSRADDQVQLPELTCVSQCFAPFFDPNAHVKPTHTQWIFENRADFWRIGTRIRERNRQLLVSPRETVPRGTIRCGASRHLITSIAFAVHSGRQTMNAPFFSKCPRSRNVIFLVVSCLAPFR